MGSELDNANPTILNISELPSHRQRRGLGSDGPKKEGIQEILMAKPSYALDPFYMSDSSDGDSDDSTLEPIDKQEIYGEINTFSLAQVEPQPFFLFYLLCQVLLACALTYMLQSNLRLAL